MSTQRTAKQGFTKFPLIDFGIWNQWQAPIIFEAANGGNLEARHLVYTWWHSTSAHDKAFLADIPSWLQGWARAADGSPIDPSSTAYDNWVDNYRSHQRWAKVINHPAH